MGAKSGAEYVERLNAEPREVWIHGQRVEGNISDHPAFRNVIRSMARLYDMQLDPATRDEMTYEEGGQRYGLSWLVPKTRDDLVRRGRMMQRWARATFGMMGRTSDYLNVAIMAMSQASAYFAGNHPSYAENIQAYYQYARERDLTLTHTLISPQVNRSVSVGKLQDPYIAARVVEKNRRGVVIRGARLLATQGPIADEILVFPSTVLRNTEEDAPYSFAFAIPSSTPGLRYICRESFDYGRSHFDHPLGSRFEEMDAIVVFDDVLVPWDRVFLLEDAERCNQLHQATHAVVHMTYQVMHKNIAKCEFLLGLAEAMVDAIGIAQFQHVKEKVAEIILALETMKAFLRASEADAELDEYGVMTPAWAPLNAARNLFPKTYPRLVEIIQQLGASGLMAIPTEADWNSEIRGDLERFLQGRNIHAFDRLRLFRLAWDAALSSFGSRQVLYERFFFGDPVRMYGALYDAYDKTPYVSRVKAFLDGEAL
ncbi:4-hydroxyphenylacetate 3-monooxygenase, oxygenase component [Alicyclobacillus acidocaldarius]|uniref:4-hydroxyphenylacetate 3-monooxygenase, oxygenase subunit n=1 Tax=Alicyclobacillus acidocaldarius subsp. acidocaldarius (strain ATCC 27009 / DSM 446 / BCRC 14685 / JCM 5260 / KCTC 1825 / NBRC 15652 / NCIMB 11725 / NRRL B-14509 / 104-IA) TaxID=521098 RepID=C8WRJ3_ALIAD|nr:4-hydroxyphenylacetate 3-monooxygenase, oxygenase component [Alicyclobacillus acidocaldarius]ACV57398.1 4-hydroxyphenylacetate 3-monooxygenase, oxygenase subunit [Alicyclobacillus acidocaldarius subsp. acidocaldarius DSM 446]